MLWLAAALSVASESSGQPADVTPPVLEQFVEAKAPAPATETAVVLELTIDAAGRVSEATVVESASPELDRAAVEAAKQFRFAPARRGDEAIAVRVRYRYVFAAAAPEPEPEPASEPKPEPAPPPAPTEPKPAEPEPEYGATAEVEAPTRSVTRRSMKAEELARVPGVRGDAIRAVDILPGVGRSAPFDGSTPVIRGAGSNESQVFLDGTPVPLLFHFGGITSFFQSRLLDRVELYPSNFSARWGRVSGGVVEARVREPRRDRIHGMLDLSVLDSAALVEAPLGERGGMAAAVRRSNVDFFFEQFVPEDAYSVVAAPVYWDYQLLATQELGGGHRLRLLGYGSRDSIELLFSDPNEADPTLRGDVGGSIEFHHLNARLDSRLSGDVKHALSLTLGYQDLQSHIGPWLQELDAFELHARSELEVVASREVELAMGLDFAGQLADGRYVGPRPPGLEGDPTSREFGSLVRTFQLQRDGIPIVQPALWAEMSWRPVERVLIVPGVRADYFEQIDAWSVDPRLGVRLEASDQTTLKGGVGLFTEPPEWYEPLDGVGNPALDPYRALHLSAGVEQKLGAGVELGLEAFYKRLWDRVVGTPGGVPPYLINDGSGRIVGAELSAGVRPTPRTFGYVAYTLSRSERRNGNEDWRVFDNDQTHVLSAVASQKLGAGWELGARFRYVTGNPRTPVVAAVYDARIDQYRPVYGAVNSEREEAFHQLDVRVEKQWHISELTLAVYLEVMNAYNQQNPEGTRFSYDYSERETVSGMPILPNLGVRGEL